MGVFLLIRSYVSLVKWYGLVHFNYGTAHLQVSYNMMGPDGRQQYDKGCCALSQILGVSRSGC